MAQRDATQSVIDRSTALVFDPIRQLCTSVRQVGQVITNKIPTLEDVRAAKKKGELTTGQITAFRQLEKRIENDQKYLQATSQMLDSLEEAVGSMEEKAEAADYEATVLDQTIPAIKALLASKYQIFLRPTSSSSTTDDPAVLDCPLIEADPDAAVETSRPQAPRGAGPVPPMSVSREAPSQLQRLPNAKSRIPPISINNSERIGNLPENLHSVCKNKINGQASGIPVPGYRQSPSASTSNLSFSYRSPNQAHMPVYRPVPQSASNGHSSASPQQSTFRYSGMSAARSSSVLNHSSHNSSFTYRPPIYTPPPPQSEMDKINGLLARLEGKKRQF